MLRNLLLSFVFLTGIALGSPNVSVTLQQADLVGQPGESVRWSLSIQMLFPNLWAVINQIELWQPAPLGEFFPFSNFGSDLVIGSGAAPNADPFVFNNYEGSGVGYFVIDPLAQPGNSVAANFLFQFTVFTKDPNNDPSFDPDIDILGSEDVFVDTSITVASSGQGVPEASTFGILGAGLALIGFLKKKR